MGTLSSLIIFAIPGVKQYFARTLAARHGGQRRSRPSNSKADVGTGAGDAAGDTKGEESDRDHRSQTLGLPDDPAKELDEAVKELRADIDEVRRRKS